MHTLICVPFSLPPGVGDWLRFLPVALPGLFCLPFDNRGSRGLQIEILRISLIETESGKESKGYINISVVVIGIFCYGDCRRNWHLIA